MKVPMLKASFIGRKGDLKGLIEILKSTASFEMSVLKRASNDIVDSERESYDRFVNYSNRLKNAIAFSKQCEAELKIKNRTWNTTSEIEYNGLKAFAQHEDIALEIASELEELHNQMTTIKNDIATKEDLITQLKPYINLKTPFNDIMLESKSVFILVGIISTKKFEKFKSDFNLSMLSIESVPSGTDKQCIVIACHREDAPVAEAIYEYGFEQCKFDYVRNASDMIREFENEIVALRNEYNTALHHASSLSTEEIRAIKNFYDYVSNEIDTTNLTASTLTTAHYYVLNGWIIESAKDSINDYIAKRYPDIVMQFDTPTEHDTPPVLVKNSKFIAPFSQITNMYGPPARNDIDPNPFVALFYFIFFGMMLGDMGYGLLLTVGAALFIYIKKPSKGTKQFILLFGISGVSAILWGVIYGSIFGIGLPTQIIDPVSGAVYLLLLSLGMGLVQLFFGICLNFYKNILNKNYGDAFLNSMPRMILFIGLFMFLPKGAFDLFKLGIQSPFLDAIFPVGLYIALVGIAGMIIFGGRGKKGFFGKLAGAFGGAYGLVNYFSDVLSYARLFALALVGAVIAMIGNILGELFFGIPIIGYPIGFIVAALFHTFNIGLSCLSAYVHGARLHFIEFFSKFYSGEGTDFKAIGSNLTYTRVK